MIEISCKEKIRGRMHLMTITETKIANYVLNNYEAVLNNNITELAENSGVSDASVVRFCKGLGYKGYQDFKVNAARDVLPKDKHFNPKLKQSDDDETICKKIMSSEIEVLKRTLSSLDMDTLSNTVEVILSANKIIFFGSGGSLLVGKDAQHKFMKIGIFVFVYEDIDMQLMSSSLMKKDDVALCISHSGSNYNVLQCLKNAKENGAKTIALVTQGKTPISKSADYVLYTASEETMFRSESVSTRIAQLAVLDTLISIVAFRNYDKSYQAIQETRKSTSQNKF